MTKEQFLHLRNMQRPVRPQRRSTFKEALLPVAPCSAITSIILQLGAWQSVAAKLDLSGRFDTRRHHGCHVSTALGVPMQDCILWKGRASAIYEVLARHEHEVHPLYKCDYFHLRYLVHVKRLSSHFCSS